MRTKLCLFLIFVRGGRRRDGLRRLLSPGTTHRTAQERRLLLLGWNLRGLLRGWRSGGGPFTLRCRRGLLLLRSFGPEAAVSAVAELAIGTVRALVPLTTTVTAVLRTIATVAVLPAIVAIAVFARPVPVVPIASELPVAAITPVSAIETLSVAVVAIVVVALLVPIVPRTIVVAVLMIEIAWLLLIGLLLRTFAALLLRLDAELVAVLLAAFIAIVSIGTGERMRTGGAVIAKRINSALLRHLFAVAQDDAIVMLGVLKIIFSENRIARRQRIARQRNILFRDMRGGATDLHVRTRALEAPHQGVL